MLDLLFRLTADLGPTATWFLFFFAATTAVFVLYIGIAMRAVLRADDPDQRQVRYQIFRDLLGLLRRGEHQ
jgi:hypothetical protein